MSSVARRLPLLAAMHLCGLTALGTSACVIPIPPGDFVGDAGLNASPVIVSSNPPMPFQAGAPIVLECEPDPENPVSFTIDVYDANVGDKLWVRVFRDYDGIPPTVAPNPIYIAERTAIANDGMLGGPLRPGIEVETALFCVGADCGRNIVFDVVVSDRPFVEDLTAQPINRVPSGIGLTSVRSWIGICQ